jgi:bla regulator protein blaR1
MQSLLADRFKLVVHFESNEQPVLALILVKPPRLGPRIRPHEQGLSCDAKWTAPLDRGSSSVPPGGFLPSCGAFNVIDTAKRTVLFGARDVTLKSLAANLGIIPLVSRFSRSVVDGTGINGSFDLSLEFSPERGDPQAADALDNEGPSFEEALRDQLGLKLKPRRADIQTIVIDHVEQPSPN